MGNWLLNFSTNYLYKTNKTAYLTKLGGFPNDCNYLVGEDFSLFPTMVLH
jgi:hypothetical protein